MEKKSPYVFLADDDADDRLLFTDALEELPTPTTVATFDNGVELMAELLNPDSQYPDIIFLDLNMPLMNGEECLADIRDEATLDHIPIVIYSTSLDIQKVELLQQKGADRYLKKPNSFELLKASLECALQSIEAETTGNERAPDFIIKT